MDTVSRDVKGVVMYGHTHGCGGICMDTHMVVGVHVWTHTW